MGSFLKKILEPSEQDAFDHLTWMEKPFINMAGLHSEDVPPSPNVGLPAALIPRQPPGPAYVTHTGPLVRLLLLQERPGRAPAAAPAPARPGPAPAPARPGPQPRSEPRGAAERSPVRSGTAGIREHPTAVPSEKSTLAPPSVCHRVTFARKPPSTVLPQSNPACSNQRE
ncbi:uncharacterized protein LOC130260689 isoform X2 [Oenanthe melanoleuca]|nr:uncharacterized protein LOC130260689 isoform X2 [Oenanthe melanoleuca]